MSRFQKIVNSVIGKADIVILVLDARLVQETRNPELEEIIKSKGRSLVYVITKSDLVEGKDELEKFKKELNPCVFISAKNYAGVGILKERIMIEAKRLGISDRAVIVGVIGYPNVGKSSLINAVTGRSAASTSSMSGHTRGVQKIRAGHAMVFLDTPGVIPPEDDDAAKHAIIGSVDQTKSKEPDLAVMKIMDSFPGRIEKFYEVEPSEDHEETLEEIARKKCMFKKGGIPDIDRVSREILKCWQTGKIK